MTPVSVALNVSVSLEPALLDWIWKEPLILSVPLAPLYLPTPPVTWATPVTVTVVGALSAAAQALVAEDETTLSSSFEPPPVIDPVPDSGSQVL